MPSPKPGQNQIRSAGDADYEAVDALFAAADALHHAALPDVFAPPGEPARDRAYIAGLLGDPAVAFLVAEIEGAVAGVIVARLRAAPPIPVFVGRRYVDVDSIVVHDRYRRAGIGRRLLEAVEQWAVERGASAIELNVWEFNDVAIAFYERLGYATRSRRMGKPIRPTRDRADAVE